MTPYIIGIDFGTGSTKAVAVNAVGDVLYSTQVSYPSIYPQAGWHEQVPELIWQAFIKCVKRTIENISSQPIGISLSSAMHGVLAVDETGTPLMNIITWADKRCSGIAEKLKHAALSEMLYEQTGTPIHAMSPLCKIIWLRENSADLFSKTYKFISIKEFIWFKLFGYFEIDHSLASAMGLFDIEKLVWNENALSLADISTDRLSTPVPTNHQRKNINATVARLAGISGNPTFIIGASDGCMANLGSFATDPGMAALTIGTSGAIRVGNSKPTYNFQAMTFNYVLDEKTFISGGPVNNGGAAIKWYVESFLKKKLESQNDYNAILGEIETVDGGSNGLIFLPYLMGERAPIWNSDACGVFFGITIQHQQAHFTRAVVEGITFALYDVACALEESGLNIHCIHVSGGFVHSQVWLQILSNIFNKKVCLVNQEDASASGAAYLGLKTLGLVADYKELKTGVQKEYNPDITQHDHYLKSFKRYRKLYDLLKDEMH